MRMTVDFRAVWIMGIGCTPDGPIDDACTRYRAWASGCWPENRPVSGAPALLGQFVTNADGRVDQPLLAGEALIVGIFELRFQAGDYLRRTNANLAEPLFLDVIPIQFGVSDANAHYHVPLLISPFGYSTYRGS